MAHLYPFAEDEKPKPTDTGKQRDINTQLALSIALGLAAFLTFCVCLLSLFTMIPLLITSLGSPAKMDVSLCGSETAEECSVKSTRAAGQLLWVDTSTVPDIGGRGARFSWA